MNKDSKALEALYEGILSERHDEVTTVDGGHATDSSAMAKNRSETLSSKVGNYRVVLRGLGYQQDSADQNKFTRNGQTVTVDQDLAGGILVNDQPYSGSLEDFLLQYKGEQN